MSQARFQKAQREKARRAKAATKSARREERRAGSSDPQPDPPTERDQSAILAELAALHERFEAGDVDFDDFVAAKEELTDRLDVR